MKLRGKRRRVAVSELIGTLLMVSITLIAGVAVFGYINGQAGVSEKAYGDSVANNVNFLRESYSIVTQQFQTCSGTVPTRTCTTLAVWIFNKGQVTLNISSITIETPPGFATPWSLTFKASSSGGSCSVPAITPSQKVSTNLIPISTLSSTSVTVPACLSSDYMVDGQSYLVIVQGLYGNTVQAEVQANG